MIGKAQTLALTGRSRAVGSRLAAAGLVFLLAPGALAEESGTGNAPIEVAPEDRYEPLQLPSTEPAATPRLLTEHETKIWSLILKHSEKYGVADEALAMYHVLWEESRLVPSARSACGRYLGIGQFTRRTFLTSVKKMKQLGLVSAATRFSPFDPDQAIEVMAWMWSAGYSRHWGVYKRVQRRLEKERPPEVVSASRLVN